MFETGNSTGMFVDTGNSTGLFETGNSTGLFESTGVFDTGNSTVIFDPNKFGAFFFDTKTNKYNYSSPTADVLNGTSIDVDMNGDLQRIVLPLDDPMFISPESYSEVVNNTIQNITDALVEDVTEKVVENVNATLTEAIEKQLTVIEETISDQDVSDEFQKFWVEMIENLEELKIELVFNLEIGDAADAFEILKEKTEQNVTTGIGFLNALKSNVKGVKDVVIVNVQGTLEQMNQQIARYGMKMKTLYETVAPLPQKLSNKIKNIAEEMVKTNFTDFKLFFESKPVDDIVTKVKSQREKSQQFRSKKRLERAANEDTSALSKSLTGQVKNYTYDVGTAYKDIFEHTKEANNDNSKALVVFKAFQQITEEFLSNNDDSKALVVFDVKDINENEFSINIPKSELNYWESLFTRGLIVGGGLAMGVGVGRMYIQRYALPPQTAEKIVEGLTQYRAVNRGAANFVTPERASLNPPRQSGGGGRNIQGDFD
jgi:hypothetical protein